MLKVLELFGGIGACSKALERLGIEYEIADYVEIDKYAVKSFNAIHGTNFEPQDVCTWDKDIKCDLIMHGSPCQDFSLAGKQAGGDEGSGTRSSLMYETVRIVEKLKPKYVIWENVKNVISKKHIHNFNNYLEKMKNIGYTSYYQVLNAKDYGIPQNRERVFTISIRNDINLDFIFPPKQELKLKLKDMLEDNVDEKYYLSNKMVEYVSATGTANFRNPDSKINLDVARPLTTDPNKRAGTTNYLSDELPENCDLNDVVRKYGVFDTDKSKHQADSVYDSNGLSPTLDTMQGGYGQPCIEECNKVINVGNVNPSGRGQSGAVVDSDGLTRTITIEKGEGQKILIKNATKKGYLEAIEGDGIDLAQPNSETRRGRVQKEAIQTLDCSGGNSKGVVVSGNYMSSNHDTYRVVDNERLTPTVKENHKTATVTMDKYSEEERKLFTDDGNIKRYVNSDIVDEFKEGQMATTSFPNGYGHGPRTHDESIALNTIDKPSVKQNLRIRKLTPKECWRLMGFDDSDFEKAEKVNSNTQLYKQAGNSIVVNVLEVILSNLLINNKENKWEDLD